MPERRVTERSIFPVRGAPDDDRQYRHPRQRSEKTLSSAARREMAKARRAVLAKEKSSAAKGKPRAIDPDPWKNLPPLEDLIDGVDRFTRHYFQLGFIPKKQFPERLRRNHKQVNVFLLMSILSISARLSPALSARYGNGIKAAEYFMERAAILAVGEVYQEPSLERCQGFYLLSISQQGSGLQNKSFVRSTSFHALLDLAVLPTLDGSMINVFTTTDQHGHCHAHGCSNAIAPRRNLPAA